MSNFLIILNYQDEKRVTSLVESALSMDVFDKVIIADNNSSGNSGHLLQSHFSSKNKVIVLFNPNNSGYGGGNNFALREIDARGYRPDFVTLINSDVLFTKSCIENCVSTLCGNNELACCTPTMLSWDHKIEMNCWNYSSFWVSLSFCFYLFGGNNRNKYFPVLSSKQVNIVDVIRGTLVVYRFSAFKKVGFFDENTFLYWEEDCLSKKFREEGYREALITTCSFVHNHKIRKGEDLSFQGKMRQYHFFCRSMMYYNVVYNHINFFERILMRIAIIYDYVEKFFLVGFYKILHHSKK
jgi:GT2 family glycosyltransferase